MYGKGDPAEYTPCEFITHTLPPTLIIQGEEDTIVPARDARAFRDAAEKAGRDGRCMYIPGWVDSDSSAVTDAHQREDAFLVTPGYIPK
jgi:hypothetical protein